MVETKDSNDVLPYYGDMADDAGIGKIVQMPLNFNLAKEDFKSNFADAVSFSLEISLIICTIHTYQIIYYIFRKKNNLTMPISFFS